MDRDRRWPRIRLAYDLIMGGKAEYRSSDPFIAVDQAYARGESDEFIKPTAIGRPGEEAVTVADGDVIVFANYRADRARQLSRAMTKPGFEAFEREHWPRLSAFISLTSYKADYEFPVAFPAENPDKRLWRTHRRARPQTVAHRRDGKIRACHLLLQRRQGAGIGRRGSHTGALAPRSKPMIKSRK